MRKRLLAALGLVFAAAILWTGVAYATGAKTGENITIGKDETVEASVYAGGNTVTIAGVVKGDVFCGAQKVEITGTVEGDVLCGGQTVKITGRVTGDVRVGGQSVTIAAPIEGSLSVAGQLVTIQKEATVGRDLTAIGQSLDLSGNVARDVTAAGENISLQGVVARNATAYGELVQLTSSANIQGNLYYASQSDLNKQDGAIIAGSTERMEVPSHYYQESAHDAWMSAVYWFLAMLVTGLALWVVAPKSLDRIGNAMRQKALLTTAAGIAGLVVLPFAAILFMATVIGLPIGLIVFMFAITAVLLAFVFTSYSIGQWIVEALKWPQRGIRVVGFLSGLLVLTILVQIPVLGALFGLAAIIWGMGGFLYVTTQFIARQRAAKTAKS